MSRYLPPSLLQCFAPPESYVGTFGWLCGYSADAAFLDAAAERFTRQTTAQRAYAGKLALIVLLDSGQSQVLPHDAPGVLHAPMRDASHFALLHAKLALLGYRHEQEPERWCLRLVVSTGNWTRETLERSLDAMWLVEVRSEDLALRDLGPLQARADVAAAWDLFHWLQPKFDLGALEAEPRSLTALARGKFDAWVRAVDRPRRKARFFDSRKKSLLRQLPEFVRHHAGEMDRNTLMLGSGFYEGGTSKEPPVALVQIVDALRDAGLATRSCEVHLFVEPTACQAVASGLTAIWALGWRVWAAEPPPFLDQRPARTLHAKFIFGCGYRKDSDKCLNGWIYLGSGNLTRPGILQNCPQGNLEAGVVFGDDALTWSKPGQESCASSRLPMQWKHEVKDVAQLQAGSEMPERPPAFVAPPVSWCRYVPLPAGQPARLVLPAYTVPVEVLDTAGNVCAYLGPQEVVWRGAQQPSVVVQWSVTGEQLRCSIPVIDSAGRVAAVELPKLDLESAWWQLAQFPQSPAEEDCDTDTRDFETGTVLARAAAPDPVDSAIRTMMRLMENVADKQAGLSEADWDAWCISLEQALRQAADCPVVDAFKRQLALNPLAVLRAECSLPVFARDPLSAALARYLPVLDAVEKCWEVCGLESVARSGENEL
ncbi:hypothetical protein KGA65_04325 [Ideonella sp. B7]|uniref:hypothetical protein n=1 Tax=Ideonella benzenivorans TaxID=2831643 RepID=UPI001CECB36E|nr:hypothetical protein [Ideonella benzenivorans]MCA6215767.1 hypothetical protein [Ideonella benzenivorans]